MPLFKSNARQHGCDVEPGLSLAGARRLDYKGRLEAMRIVSDEFDGAVLDRSRRPFHGKWSMARPAAIIRITGCSVTSCRGRTRKHITRLRFVSCMKQIQPATIAGHEAILDAVPLDESRDFSGGING